MNVLFEEHLQVLQFLIKHEVKFLLIGGYAVNYYGYTRTTGDMDLWIEPTNENKLKMISALTDFGILKEDLYDLGLEDFTEHIVFSFGQEPFKIDFITRVNLVDFKEAFENSKLIEIDGIKLLIVRYNDLILMKMNTGRAKDRLDIEKLQDINGKNMK